MNAKKIAIALLALGVWLIPVSQVPAATAAPAWHLALTPLPTNFKPGSVGTISQAPLYRLVATNIGGAPTSGPITLTAALPAGLNPIGAEGDAYVLGSPVPTCAIVVQTVTCTAPGPVYPGRWLGAKIAVEVPLDAEGTLTAEASISGGGAQTVATAYPTQIDTSPPSFGFLPGAAGLGSLLTSADGSPSAQAGSHPNQLTVNIAFPTEQSEPGAPTKGAGHPRDLITDLPRGLIVNPEATPVLCTEAQLTAPPTPTEPGCPAASQVGLVTTMTEISGPFPPITNLYNMVPPPGVPAMFAFNAVNAGIYVHLKGGVRSDGDYGLSSTTNDILAKSSNPIMTVQAQLWGDPSSASHDAIRGACRLKAPVAFCPVTPQTTALLTMPSECSGKAPITSVSVASWEEPGVFHQRSVESQDLFGNPVPVEGCNQLQFEPTTEAKPTTNLADSPSGLDFNLHQPQSMELEGLSTAALKDAVVTLPEGMAANPSQADGLAACSASEIGLTTEIGAIPIHLSKAPDSCPDASKLGTVQVSTPLLDDPLSGALYLAKPFDNPFGSLLAIYLSVNDPKTGTIAKFAGKVEADPLTGQLSTRVTENPQLPLEDVDLHLFTGPRAPLRTPPTCDTYTTTSDLTPWSSPEGADAHPTDSFAVTGAPGGGDCPASADGAPNQPSFSAGTISPQAGAYSPFVLKVTREDATQPLAGIEATLPPGLTGKLAGIPYCTEAQIAQAQARSHPNEGALELSNPSCPPASEVGTVDVAAGAGITPLHVEGHAYLAGPYKNAPLSMAIVTPAVAGPFDLGAVTVRTALYLNPKTAQIHAVSDPLPTILEGIPLDVRSVSLKMGRPQFTLNPTSCDPMAIDAITTSVFSQPAALSSPFQVGGCSSLGFKPRLSIRLKGKTKRGGHPALTAIASFTEGDANVKKAAVTLPRSAFLDQGHIRTVCTRVQFAAEQCPAGSVYGFARAFTPLLDQPLEGPVYLRSSDHELPDLVAALSGQVDVELVGRVDSIKGGIRSTFEAAPDAPVSKFVLTMQGGRKGLLINSADLCTLKASARRAMVLLDAQNGKTHDFRPVVQNDCGRKAKPRKHRRR